MSLTPEQLAHYRDRGYVVVACPFSEDAATELMRLAREHRDLSNADGVRISRLDPRYTVADTNEATLALLANPTVLSMVQQIYGSDDFRLLLHGWNNRTPGVKPLIHWHTDYQESQRLLGGRVEVSWYLTPTREENGCLRLIPGSHRRPVVDTRRELAIVAKERGQLWRHCEVRHPREISLPLGPGNLLLRDGFVWHCTFENRTRGVRYMYGWSYAPLAERAMVVDYELLLPRRIVEAPSPVEARLFSLDEEYQRTLVDRNGEPARPLRVRLGYESDREWRAAKHYSDGEDVRFENL